MGEDRWLYESHCACHVRVVEELGHYVGAMLLDMYACHSCSNHTIA